MEDYIESLYQKDQDLERVLQGIEAAGMPQISIAPGYGRLLTLLVKIVKAKHILEIGALAGYSGICLARGLAENEDGSLLSLEINADFAELSRKHVADAGLQNKVEYLIGDASVSLAKLAAEGRRFDFFFIDADKAAYPHYLERAIELSMPGALIVADNTLVHGKVKTPNKQAPTVMGMREFNQRITQDARLECAMLPAYDGLAIARVKG